MATQNSGMAIQVFALLDVVYLTDTGQPHLNPYHAGDWRRKLIICRIIYLNYNQ